MVLAAGRSTRMGAGPSKVLWSIDGAPMVARVVDALSAAALAEVVVVTGHQAEAVQAALTGRAARLVYNPAFAAGLSTSLRAGITALGRVDAAVVALADMPWLRPEHVRALVAAFARRGQICAPVFEGRRGNPVLWPARFFGPLTTLSGDEGARRLLAEYGAQVEGVPVSDAGVLRDVDDPIDLART